MRRRFVAAVIAGTAGATLGLLPATSASAGDGGRWRCSEEQRWNDWRWDECCNRDWRDRPSWCWDDGGMGGNGGNGRHDWNNWHDSNWNNWRDADWSDSGRGGNGDWGHGDWSDSGRGGNGDWGHGDWSDSGRGGNGDWGHGGWGGGR